jgi:hypothetical protein
MQINKSAWGNWFKTHNWDDPNENAMKGAEILADSMRVANNNITQALQRYATGQLDNRGDPTAWPDGKNLYYADSVQRHQAMLHKWAKQ